MPPQDSETARWYSEHLAVHESMLRAWLQSRFPEGVDFDDVIQESALRVLAAHAKREIRFPKAFFFTTARNLAYTHYQKSHVHLTDSIGEPDDFPVIDETADITENIARHQEIELMTQAIQSLPERCRQVLTLRNVYGLSYKEIASQLSISVRTVEVHLATGVRRCADYVSQFRDR